MSKKTKEMKKTIEIILKIFKMVYILFILFCFSVNVESGLFMLIASMVYLLPVYLLLRWLIK